MLRLQQYAEHIKERPESTAHLRRTRIVCTIGPKNAGEEMIETLVDAGMDIMRLNFSHGSHEWFEEVVGRLRSVMARKGEAICAVALDTKGPEIRTGTMAGGAESATVTQGSTVEVTVDPQYKDQCTASRIFVDYPDLCSSVSPGMTVFVDDGLLNLEVTEVLPDQQKVVCVASNTADISDHKGVNLPGAVLTLPAVSEKDRKDLAFGAGVGVDFVFASFIRSAAQVREVRRALLGWPARVIAKIENEEGLNNIDEIIEEADGVMVARGDMGIEIPASAVFAAQKMIISKCNARGKPVICATQMLESMIQNPRPTRAEVTDVGTAILDGADCVMLSGETAKGKWPREAVTTMSKVCRQAERLIDHREIFRRIETEALGTRDHDSLRSPAAANEAVAASCVEMALNLQAPGIIIVATTGNTARLVSKFRPPVPILVICFDDRVARQLCCHRGVFPLVIDSEVYSPDLHDTHVLVSAGIDALRALEVVRAGDRIVALHSERVLVRSADPDRSVGGNGLTKKFAGSAANLASLAVREPHKSASQGNLAGHLASRLSKPTPRPQGVVASSAEAPPPLPPMPRDSLRARSTTDEEGPSAPGRRHVTIPEDGLVEPPRHGSGQKPSLGALVKMPSLIFRGNILSPAGRKSGEGARLAPPDAGDGAPEGSREGTAARFGPGGRGALRSMSFVSRASCEECQGPPGRAGRDDSAGTTQGEAAEEGPSDGGGPKMGSTGSKSESVTETHDEHDMGSIMELVLRVCLVP